MLKASLFLGESCDYAARDGLASPVKTDGPLLDSDNRATAQPMAPDQTGECEVSVQPSVQKLDYLANSMTLDIDDSQLDRNQSPVRTGKSSESSDIIEPDAQNSSRNSTLTDSSSFGSRNSSTARSSSNSSIPNARIVKSGEFEPELHFYPRCLNAQIHPLVSSFFSLGNERIITRYTHLNPQVNEEKLRELLQYQPSYFAWGGCDLFNVTDAHGKRQMIVIETNSCPSGQKSMPLLQDHEEFGGYRVVIEHTFKDILSSTNPSVGGVAVAFDKNKMEASGYASVLADIIGENVYMVEYHVEDLDPPVRWVDRVMQVRDENENWIPIRACFRYVTQKPWNRFPLNSKTVVLNSIISCLAGGRNKMMASKAYEFLNAELISENSGLEIRVPETVRNVSKSEIPLWIETMGGHAVIKVPYSNAGQGVYTITNQNELNDFMEMPHHYDKFIVQSLVGNSSWSSLTRTGRFYHVGTIPNKKSKTFVSDLRMMVSGNTAGKGFRPVAIYARKARKPLLKNLSDDKSISSWEMLGTNLSLKLSGDESAIVYTKWTTETQRLLLMDRKDFNTLGIGIDDLIDAYVQTVLSIIAIDKLCKNLMPLSSAPNTKPHQQADLSSAHVPSQPQIPLSNFNFDLFQALNPDEVLLDEILL